MSAESLYTLLERITNLLRNEERAVGQEHGLQPVHLQALHYLAMCNRYSNTPAGLTEYLGLTKGTVSQTIALLEGKGLVEKESSSTDRRVTHLHLTGEGRALLGALLPPRALPPHPRGAAGWWQRAGGLADGPAPGPAGSARSVELRGVFVLPPLPAGGTGTLPLRADAGAAEPNGQRAVVPGALGPGRAGVLSSSGEVGTHFEGT